MEGIIFVGVIALVVISLYITNLCERISKVEQSVYHVPVEVPYTLLSPFAKTPTRGTPDSAGLDLYAAQEYIIPAHSRKLVSTGVAFAVPKGFYGICTGRSGITIKQGVIGQLGIIDSDYRGAVGVMMFNTSDEDFAIKTGDRIGQIVIVPYLQCLLDYHKVLDDTDRGKGGFGSTGK